MLPERKKARNFTKVTAKAKENEDPSKPKVKKRPLPPPRPVMANPYKKVVTLDREQDELADILNMVAAPRSPSPPIKRRKTLPPASRYGFESARSSHSNASSAFATSSDPVIGEGSSFTETGPSSDGLDLFADNASQRSRQPHISGTEDRLNHLDLDDEPFFGGNDFSDLDIKPDISMDVTSTAAKEESGADVDDDMLMLKAVRKSKPASGAAKRQLVNTTSMKVRNLLPTPAPSEEDIKPEIKAVKTLQDAKKVKGMDWQLAAAAVTIDIDEGEVFDEADGLTGMKGPRKFKAPSVGGVSFASAKVQAQEEDGSIRFFWLDYVEHNGVLHFIGKVFDKESKKYVSSCMTVEGIDRNLYVLPRQATADGELRIVPEYNQADQKSIDYGNDVPAPSEDEVYDEFGKLATEHKIREWMGKQVDRKYAFELPDVPQETSYLKVLYSFDRA